MVVADEVGSSMEGRMAGHLRDPRSQFPDALVDVTKHAVAQARKRWPMRMREMSDAQVADYLMDIYQTATQVERRRDGKWRYRLHTLWVVATLGYDQQTVVLLTCYPTRRIKRTQTPCASISSTAPVAP